MTFIYGDRDWMDPKGGQRALAGARERRQPTTPGDLRLFTVSNSGHYTFVDQPEEFLQLVLTTCQPYIQVLGRTGPSDSHRGGRRAIARPASAEHTPHSIVLCVICVRSSCIDCLDDARSSSVGLASVVCLHLAPLHDCMCGRFTVRLPSLIYEAMCRDALKALGHV